MKIPLFWRIMPLYAIVATAVVLSLWQSHAEATSIIRAQSSAESILQEHSKTIIKTPIAGLPYRIVLPTIEIDLPVVSGGYDPIHKNWPVDPSAANYATNTSENNNESKKTLIYGHGTARVFENTKALATGDTAYVYTSGNHIFKYIFKENKQIALNDVGIFSKLGGAPGLVLMTCDGYWNQYRRISFFDLVSESK